MNAILRGIAFVLSMAACTSANAVPFTFDWNTTITASNPLNWYRFDELSGSIAVDYGSEHLNGTYGAGALDATRDVAGLVGGAVQFGDQSTVFLSASDLAGDWTAEFLLMRTGSKRSSVLIRGIPFAFPSQSLKLEQFNDTHQVGYTKYGIVDATFDSTAVAPLNRWIHLAFVNRAADDRVSLYMNGALIGTRIDHFALSRDQIGSWSDTIPESPLAIMDEAVIYNRALLGRRDLATCSRYPGAHKCDAGVAFERTRDTEGAPRHETRHWVVRFCLHREPACRPREHVKPLSRVAHRSTSRLTCSSPHLAARNRKCGQRSPRAAVFFSAPIIEQWFDPSGQLSPNSAEHAFHIVVQYQQQRITLHKSEGPTHEPPTRRHLAANSRPRRVPSPRSRTAPP